MAPPRPGDVVAGCRLVRALGAGAMGAAYLAERVADGRQVVVKVLAADVLAGEHARARFAREAHALSRLPPHPNVVHVLGVALDAAPPALVLEHAPGPTLEALVRERGALPPLEAARVVLDVARGLAVIHAQGLVHRDVKPANVVLGPDGHARLIDFGVAKDSFLSGITAPGALVGTTLYMAPERLLGEDEAADDHPRADLWSLGAVLYHLVAGRPPFDTGDLGELADLVERAEYPPLSTVLASPPPGLEAVLAQLLEPAPRHRYARAVDVAADLERVLAGREVELPGLVAPDGRRLGLRRGHDRGVVGRGPACGLVLDDPAVAERHAQVRRTAAGVELVDLQSATGTFVDGRPVTAPLTLVDGQAVRLGGTTLVACDPRGRAAAAAAPPGRAPRAVLDDLAARGDLAVVAWMIERGDAAALAWLARTGLAPEARTAADWAAWWVGRHGELPRQVGPEGPGAALVLEATHAGQPLAARRLGPEEAVVHLGRDARCELRLDSPQVSRLHATLARLVDRWAFRNEGHYGALLGGAPAAAAVLAPGDRLTLGDVEVVLRPAPP